MIQYFAPETNQEEIEHWLDRCSQEIEHLPEKVRGNGFLRPAILSHIRTVFHLEDPETALEEWLSKQY